MIRVPTQLLSPTAIIPTYGSTGAAGRDLYADVQETIPVGKFLLVQTNIAMAIPVGVYGRIAPRSGLAYKNGIDVLAGVIDNDYRGPIGVILMNNGDVPFVVNRCDRIAQIIFERYEDAALELYDELPGTSRGSGGFGSTGTS